MRIDYVNQQIMDALVAGYPAPRYAVMPPAEKAPRGKTPYIVSINGHVAYVLEEDEVCFNLAHCRNEPSAFKYLTLDDDLLRIDNMLEVTPDVRLAAAPRRKVYLDNLPIGQPEPVLLARFKGAAWDTFINMELLEAFDEAKYYQSRKNCPVAVVEDGALVGYVMPAKVDDAEGHYTDSPSYEKPLIEDEEE
jgi:hypothetical protein